jgi:hypothetical protein
MQFQVPQFIETEDKIIGPFSLRQFAYVGAAGLISAMLYFFITTWLWIIIALCLLCIDFSLAFIKIEGQPFLRVILSAFNFYWKPQTYIWQPEHQVVTHEKEVHEEAGKSAIQEILSKSLAKMKSVEKTQPISRKTVASGSALHQSWENVQTGGHGQKNSDKQFLERKMEERYEIFQRNSGERNAAKRIDYR